MLSLADKNSVLICVASINSVFWIFFLPKYSQWYSLPGIFLQFDNTTSVNEAANESFIVWIWNMQQSFLSAAPQ